MHVVVPGVPKYAVYEPVLGFAPVGGAACAAQT